MGIIWSTMKVGEGSPKEVTTVVIGEDQVYSNKAPSTSTSTIAIGEDQVCSMYEVCEGKTTSMPVTVADLLPFKEEKSVFEPAPSDKEAWEAISTIKELFEPPAHSRISEIGCSSIITPSGSVTSEARELELITPLQSDTVQLDSELRDAIGVCYSLETCCAMREMVVGAVKDKKVWDAFMNCESVVQFKTNLSNKIPGFSQALVVTELVANIQADGNQGSEVEKYRNLKLILDKAKEMVLEVVIKAFDSMEKVFLPNEKPHQKTKQSCDFKYAEESSTSEKIFNTIEHILRTPFLATLLINTVVVLYRVIRVSLK